MRFSYFLTCGLAASLALSGCGIEAAIQDIIDDAQSALEMLSGVSDETFAVASQMMVDGDEALSALEADEAEEQIQEELNVAETSGITSLSALSPGLAAGDRLNDLRQRNRSETCYQDDCESGRLRHLRIDETFERGQRASRAVDIFFEYSSSPSAASRGDLNLSNRGSGHAYVYASVTATTQFRDSSVAAATLAGWRHWHSDPNVRYLFFSLIEELPSDERAPYKRLTWQGGWDLASDAPGAFTRDVELQNGAHDLRQWTVDESGSGESLVLTVNYNRSAPNGMTASGSGEYNLAGTRHCRLDDRGAFTLLREFPEQDTTAAYPVAESVLFERDGKVTTLDGTLTLSDGSELSRSGTRTVVAPASCDDERFPRQIEQTSTTYRGVTVTTNISREAGVMTVESSRQLTDATVDLLLVRADGLATLTVTKTDLAGDVVAELVLEVDPSGHASGTLTRTLPDGSSEVSEIDRQIDGELRMRRPGRAADEFRRLNRGEF